MAEEAAEQRPPDAAPILGVDDIATRSFPTAFRGFDPVAVRAFLADLADLLRAAEEREATLRAELQALAERASAEAPPPDADDQAAEVVDRARRAAAAIETEAVERTEAVLVAAREKADRMLADAEAEAASMVEAGRLQGDRIREEAEQEARRIRSEGERAGAAARVDADRKASELRRKAEEEAAEIVEAARERGRQMVSEAQAARERMLADLARRKRSAQAQLEQLRNGRDRLLEQLKSARRGLDEVTLRFEAADMISAARVTEARARTEPQSEANGGAEAEQAAAPSSAPSRPNLVVDSTPTPPPAASGSPAPSARASDEGAQPSSAADDEIAPEPAESEDNGSRSERRSSALRILRRNRQSEQRSEPRTPRVEPVPEAPHASEGVRIIGPTRAAEQAAAKEPEPDEAAVAVDDAEGAAVGRGEAPPAEAPEAEELAEAIEDADDQAVAVDTSEGEVGSTGEAPGASDTADVADAVATGEEDEPTEPGEVEQGATDQPEARAEATEDAEPEPTAEERPSVDELFAKIRRDREAAAQRAREVLDRPDAEQASAAAESEPSQQEAGVAGGEHEHRSDDEESHLQRRDRALDELEVALVRRLKRALQDEQNAALDRLRTHKGALSVAVVIPEGSDQQPYREVAAHYLEEAARAGAAQSPLGLVPVSVDDLADDLASELAGNVRSRLQRALDESAREEADLPVVAERVSAVFRESKTHRTAPLGTHYLVAAFARGAFLATPEGQPLRWVVDDDGPCPDCDDNALAGPTPRGQAFPTGQLLPPAHVGCRCLLVPAG